MGLGNFVITGHTVARFSSYFVAVWRFLQRTGIVERINRHTYTWGILEGIGVCIGVPAKRGQTQNTTVGTVKGVDFIIIIICCYLWPQRSPNPVPCGRGVR